MIINKINIASNPVPVTAGIKNVLSPSFSATLKVEDKEDKEKKNKHKKALLIGFILGGISILSPIALKQAKSTLLKIQVTKFYNNVWDEIIEVMDTTKYQIEKPLLSFSNRIEDSVLGLYDAGKNIVQINLKSLRNDEYMAYKGNLTMRKGDYALFSEKEIEELKQKGRINDSWIIQKLNKNEKSLYLNHLLAHELRHCIQYHLILNDAEYGAKALLQQLEKKIKKLNPTFTKEQIKDLARKTNTYWCSFKPKEKHSDLGLPCLKDDNWQKKYFSTKELYGSTKTYKHYGDEYTLNALEIDANAYAAAYLDKYKNLYSGCDGTIVKKIMEIVKTINSNNIYRFMDTQTKPPKSIWEV